MKPWLIFGAGGQGVGWLTAQLGLAQKRPVIALVRSSEAQERLSALGVQVILGDACDKSAVEQALQQAGKECTIISSIGGSQDYLAHRTIIDAAEEYGVTRMLLVTSLGCADSWQFLSPRAKAAFGQPVREKSLAETWLQTSNLDYAIVRPAGLLSQPATGKAQLSQHVEVHGFVTRADVAEQLALLANAETLGKQVYSLHQPDLNPSR